MLEHMYIEIYIEYIKKGHNVDVIIILLHCLISNTVTHIVTIIAKKRFEMAI